MKRLLALITFFTLSICSVMAQNDTMYVMKDGFVVGKYNTTTDLDSVIFYKPTIVEEESTSVEDVDGNEYEVVTIGDQVWMAENLKVTKYNDGTEIPLVTDDSKWTDLKDTRSPGYCYYANDISNASSYGALYNWYVVSSSTNTNNGGKNICPIGWRVPDDGDWTYMTTLIGSWTGSTVAGIDAGTKLKTTSGWNDYNGQSGNGTDAYGFSAVPGGRRDDTGYFDGIGGIGHWWSSSFSYNLEEGWFRFLSDGLSPGVDVRSSSEKVRGYSVRCIRD